VKQRIEKSLAAVSRKLCDVVFDRPFNKYTIWITQRRSIGENARLL